MLCETSFHSWNVSRGLVSSSASRASKQGQHWCQILGDVIGWRDTEQTVIGQQPTLSSHHRRGGALSKEMGCGTELALQCSEWSYRGIPKSDCFRRY